VGWQGDTVKTALGSALGGSPLPHTHTHTHTLAGTAWMSTRLMPAPLGGGAVYRPQARTQHGFPQPTGSGSGGSGRPLAAHNPEPARHKQHDEDEDDDACLAAGTEATATTLACKGIRRVCEGGGGWGW
jgi:hypothetical protein